MTRTRSRQAASPTIEIRRAGERFHTKTGWLDSKHCFSFGHHYDPSNTHHGLLLVSNDDTVKPGKGFMTHPHRDMEIVTWVLEGQLEHKDSAGNTGILYPGLAQRMSAGTGIWHSEMNLSRTDPVHFVQMWVLPDRTGVLPSYEQADINGQLEGGGLVPLASGRGYDAAISIQQQGATLWGGRLKPGGWLTIPDAAHVHVYVAKGAADLERAGRLSSGDAARLMAAGGLRLSATPESSAEVLIWESV